jgi:hypothetical protein
MPILLWYFPYIIMSGVCNLVLSTQQDHDRHSAMNSSRRGDAEDTSLNMTK